jgi:release factor glutamine methyltransferase
MLTTFRDLRLLTPRSVFAPRSDAGMLLDAAAGHVHGDVLDLCCGSGVIGLSVAPAAKHVTAVDASRVAVAATRLNALVNRRRVRALRGDLFGPVAGARFDVILSNPPYLPVPGDAPRPVGSHAWDGGPDGRALLDRICRKVAAHLRLGGRLFVVHSSLCGVDRTVELLRQSGLEAAVVASHEGPLGPLARSALGYAADCDHAGAGGPRETIVVVTACRRLPAADGTSTSAAMPTASA